MSETKSHNTDQPTIVYGSGRKPDAAIPRPGVKLRKGNVAIVVTDPQNDFLSPQGVTWSVVGQNVTDNNTVENIGQGQGTRHPGLRESALLLPARSQVGVRGCS
jgi:hypothetical protein